MGFGTSGQQPHATDYSAKRYVIGACGISSNNSCTAATFSGTEPSPVPATTINVYFTINNMTTTTINYQITSITYNDGTSVTYPYTFPTGCSSVVILSAQNMNTPTPWVYATPYFNLPTTITSQAINTAVTTSFFFPPNAPTFSVLSPGASYAYVAWWLNTPGCINPLLNNGSSPTQSGSVGFTI